MKTYIDDLPATLAAMYRRCPKRSVEIDAILRNALIVKGGKAKVTRPKVASARVYPPDLCPTINAVAYRVKPAKVKRPSEIDDPQPINYSFSRSLIARISEIERKFKRARK